MFQYKNTLNNDDPKETKFSTKTNQNTGFYRNNKETNRTNLLNQSMLSAPKFLKTINQKAINNLSGSNNQIAIVSSSYSEDEYVQYL